MVNGHHVALFPGEKLGEEKLGDAQARGRTGSLPRSRRQVGAVQ
jgi:hypothetical protein